MYYLLILILCVFNAKKFVVLNAVRICIMVKHVKNSKIKHSLKIKSNLRNSCKHKIQPNALNVVSGLNYYMDAFIWLAHVKINFVMFVKLIMNMILMILLMNPKRKKKHSVTAHYLMKNFYSILEYTIYIYILNIYVYRASILNKDKKKLNKIKLCII